MFIEKTLEGAKKEYVYVLVGQLILALFVLVADVMIDYNLLMSSIIQAIILICLYVFGGILPAKKEKPIAAVFGILLSNFYLIKGDLTLGICFEIIAINYLYRVKK